MVYYAARHASGNPALYQQWSGPEVRRNKCIRKYEVPIGRAIATYFYCRVTKMAWK